MSSVLERDLALPPGTWIKCHGIRRFVPADPTWEPTETGDAAAETVFMRLALEPAQVDVPPFKPYRHICDDCGCLLFGIENCPQCEWLAIQEVHERERAA
jgi:hypothetical protein